MSSRSPPTEEADSPSGDANSTSEKANSASEEEGEALVVRSSFWAVLCLSELACKALMVAGVQLQLMPSRQHPVGDLVV